MLAFPCNQFGAQESGNAEEVMRFVTRKLESYGVSFDVFEKIHVNGKNAHPVWHFLRYNATATRRGAKMLPIPWNFGKFLVDGEGRVFKYYGPSVSPSKMKPDVLGLLDGTLQGNPPQIPTRSKEEAPPGFVTGMPMTAKMSHRNTALYGFDDLNAPTPDQGSAAEVTE